MDLRELVEASSLNLTEKQIGRADEYINQILKWNKTRNLVSRNLSKKDLAEHFLDCAVMQRHLLPGSIIDLGTGSGFPGICLAIIDPNRAITLVDSNRKKTSFLIHIKNDLGLNLVSVKHARVEEIGQINETNIVCRAFKETQIQNLNEDAASTLEASSNETSEEVSSAGTAAENTQDEEEFPEQTDQQTPPLNYESTSQTPSTPAGPASVSEAEYIGSLDPSSMQEMSIEQIEALSSEAMGSFTSEHISNLPPEVFQVFSSQQILSLPAEATAGFTTEQITMLSPEAVAGIQVEHLQHSSAEVFEFNY